MVAEGARPRARGFGGWPPKASTRMPELLVHTPPGQSPAIPTSRTRMKRGQLRASRETHNWFRFPPSSPPRISLLGRGLAARMTGGASLEFTANTRGTFSGCLLTSRAVQRKAASPRGQGPLYPRGAGHCSGLACSHLAFDSPPGDELGAHSQKRIQRRLWNCPASNRAIVLPCSVSTCFFFVFVCLPMGRGEVRAGRAFLVHI